MLNFLLTGKPVCVHGIIYNGKNQIKHEKSENMSLISEMIPVSVEIGGNTHLRGITSRNNAHLPQPDLAQIKPLVRGASFYEAGQTMLAHPVVSVISVMEESGKILLTDKYLKSRIKAEIRGETYGGPPHKYDFASGGHITLEDLTKSDLESKMLSMTTIEGCALREMCEELRPKNKGIKMYDADKFTFIGKYIYDDNFSREVCYTFTYPMKGKASDYAVCDDYRDAAGQKHEITLPLIELTFEEFRNLAENETGGIVRCIAGARGGEDAQTFCLGI